MSRQSADGVGVGGAQIDLASKGRDEVSVGPRKNLAERFMVQSIGIHGSRWRRVRHPFFQGSTGVRSVRQRLNDDALVVNKDDVPVSEHFNVERPLPVFGVKSKGEHTVETDLFYPRQSCVSEMFSQHHRKIARALWVGLSANGVQR